MVSGHSMYSTGEELDDDEDDDEDDEGEELDDDDEDDEDEYETSIPASAAIPHCQAPGHNTCGTGRGKTKHAGTHHRTHAPHPTAHTQARAHSRIHPLIVRSQDIAVACTHTISCAIILPSRPARSSEASSASAYARSLLWHFCFRLRFRLLSFSIRVVLSDAWNVRTTRPDSPT